MTITAVILILVWLAQAQNQMIGGTEVKTFDTVVECEKGRADLLANAAATPIRGIIGMTMVCVPVVVNITPPKGAE